MRVTASGLKRADLLRRAYRLCSGDSSEDFDALLSRERIPEGVLPRPGRQLPGRTLRRDARDEVRRTLFKRTVGEEEMLAALMDLDGLSSVLYGFRRVYEALGDLGQEGEDLRKRVLAAEVMLT